MHGILIVDQSPDNGEKLAAILRKELGYVVLTAKDAESALRIMEQESICLLITEFFLPDKQTGTELLKKTHKLNPEIVTIASIPSGDRESITEVLRLGAFMYINSPYDFKETVIVASRGLSYAGSHPGRPQRSRRFRKSEGYHGIIGRSAVMQNLFDFIEKVADDDSSTVLIQGESGTGKELVAQVIHAQGPRRNKSIVPVNCAAIPDELLESELFGHTKGAFTGAVQTKMGRVQYADQGTLFLDEIGDMKPVLQAKLLRVIQEKEFEPVGGLKPIPVDIRVIAATHRDLEKMVEAGTFRQDLYYRLNVIPLNIPPLRERKEDLPLLLAKFVLLFNRNRKTPLHGFEAEAVETLMQYPWPGNIRELENLVQHMAILYGGKSVALTDLPPKYRIPSAAVNEEAAPPVANQEIQWQKGKIDFNTLINEFETRLIRQALALAKGNKKEAARLLNLKRTTLLEKIKKKNLEQDEVSSPEPSSDEPRLFP
ncbi:MAG: sigma-54-dependent Fis family transcriptional regulator [Deltaproteobacteria bacterium RIFOXYD12_FULL_57_12]|nr:MAG: sigma-54-dependent Fis family transcriptional regulator [Deltaproteobacteria bacterium RIFOXYD12_FULL_57_12]